MNILKKLAPLKGFLILWSSQAVSSLGSSMTSYALIIWVYQQKGTATSVTLLSFFTYLPSILFCFIAGTLADRWDKKKIMLISDLVSACGTLTVLILYMTGTLRIWHLYLINFLISFMNAFQSPASYVATSLLVPREYYTRVSGLQGFSGSLITILTPALASAILALCGLETVFIIDLVTFAVAFLTLMFFIRLPAIPMTAGKESMPFYKSCMTGLNFLREHRALLKLILYMSLINLLAYLTGYGILPAMILARSGGNQTVLGMVSSAMGIGTLVGSLIVTVSKPPKSRTKTIFITMAASFFLGDIVWGVGRSSWLWVFSAFAGFVLVPFTTAGLNTIMRTAVPLEMQGRVLSARDTVQFFSIPVALFLGGFLADNVFEPFMAGNSGMQALFAALVGTGKGSGMAVMFLITGVVGVISSLVCLRNEEFRTLD